MHLHAVAISPPPPSEPSALSAFPFDVQAAHRRWLVSRAPDAADAVVLAVLRHYTPADRRGPDDIPPPDHTRLMADLGYDSLALAELVFFFEDLYHVRIRQESIVHLATVADLRGYLRNRLAEHGSA